MTIFKKHKGFTLIEVLMSLVVVSIIIAGVMPTVIESFKIINQSAQENQQVLESEGQVQSKIPTNETYTGSIFPVKFKDQNTNQIDVKGSLVKSSTKEADYITFLADKSYIKINPYVLIEGYKPLEDTNNSSELIVNAYNTNFDSEITKLTILDKNDNKVNSLDYDLKSIEEEPAQPLDDKALVEVDSVLKNAFSPYIIKLETERDESLEFESAEIVQAKLDILLPNFMAAGDSGNVVVSAAGDHWVERDISANTKINSVIKGDEEFLTLGDNGQISILADGEDWNNSTIPIDYSKLSNGFNLYSGIYYTEEDENKYKLVSNYGVFVNGGKNSGWTITPDVPIYKSSVSELNNKASLYFDGDKNSINTEIDGLADKNNKAIFLVVRPEKETEILFDINDIYSNGERITLLRNQDNKLRLEIDDDSYFITNEKINNNQTYLITIKIMNEADPTLLPSLENIELEINGVNTATPFNEENGMGASVNSKAKKLYLGYNFLTKSNFNGYIPELIIYSKKDEELDSNKIENINNYLMNKYAIKSLSSAPNKNDIKILLNTNLSTWLDAESIDSLNNDDKVYYLNMNGNAYSFENNALNSITSANILNDQIMVAVGDEGLILRKKNDNDWNFVQAAKNEKLNCVVYSSQLDKFIAVGSNNGNTLIKVSDDEGENWDNISLTSISTDRKLNSIISYDTEDSTTLIAVGESSSENNSIILYSDDGNSWTEYDSETDNNLNDITFKEINKNVIFIAVGDNNIENGEDAVILYSTDVQSWTEYESGIYNNSLNGIGR